MDICAGSLVLLLAIWFALSVFNQMGGSRFPGLQRADPLQLLPRWKFFAPDPAVHDYYLLYRDKNEAGELGSWHLLQPTQARRWTSCVWNPGKVENKVISDLVQMFAEYHHSGTREGSMVMLTLPYLVWLKMAFEAPIACEGTLRQFVLAQKQGLVATDQLLPILVSDFHAI